MKRVLLVLALLVLASVANAAGDQAFLGIFAETSSMKMAGMEMPQLPAGIDLSNIPGADSMMGMGAPRRTLEVRLWSPGIAPKDAFATIVPPPGLKQGNKLELELYRPEAAKGTTQSDNDAKDESTYDPKKFTIKYYWGSSATVKPGQPKVITFGSLTPEQQKRMEASAKAAESGGSSYFYKPAWTTAYWPTKKQPGKIAKDASLFGNFTLNTNYTGNVSIDCPKNVDFLNPIDLTSPDLKEPVSLDGAIKLVWKPIPNLLGSNAMVYGMQGEDTMIIWSSSEVWKDAMMSVDWSYLQMAEVKQFVKDTIMMAGDRTDATIPKGIFKDCQMASLMMVGYGPGTAMDKTQPIPRIQTKTSLNVMLTGGEDASGDGSEDSGGDQ